ncbi:hypothetical protein BPT24_236 [Tenacibaculum phage pT24]|uniref:Uncharacterized protein n=1 Tax=Tenacibaculum phage pT24 TaxID=1880590 RepID=A0A1B4XX12_9CAUD|nr:hypothetical protein HYP10_gp292 [Tenacibaculum phage pT24]BAV39356.1 hypothetical protein BPT24_236 [Tenacibaculum phage pT24]
MKTLDLLLKKLEPLTKQVVQNTIEYYKEEGFNFTKWTEKEVRLQTQYDIINAFTKYVKSDSKIIKLTANIRAGKIVVYMIIEQDGERHPLETEVIICGGHSVQRIHYRYITKTSLKRIVDSFSKETTKIAKKRLSSVEKLIETQGILDSVKIKLKEDKNKLSILRNFKKEDIIANCENGFDKLYNTSFEDISKNDPERLKCIAKNYGVESFDEKTWNKYREENIYRDAIKALYDSKVKILTSTIKSQTERLTRLESDVKKYKELSK